MKRTLTTLSFFLLTTATPGLAEERLTLADATSRALGRNHSIKIAREDITASGARMLGAAGEYDLRLQFGVEARRRTDPSVSLFSGAPAGEVASNENTFASGASLTQLFKSGAVATVSTTVARDGSSNIYTLFDPAYTTSLGVDLRQPLLRHRAIDPARAALRVTALDRDRSGAALAREVLQTVSQVETAYWQLVAARRDLDVRRGTIALAEQQRADTQVRIQGGTVPESDLAQPIAEVERRRGDLFASQEAVARAERALKELMLDDAGDPMWSSDILPVDAPDAAPRPIDVTRALADAERHRPELVELAASMAQQDVDIALAKDSLKPQLDLVAAYTMRGLAGRQSPWATSFGGVPTTIPSSLDGSLGSSWRSLGTQTFPDASIGVSFDLPLGRRAARGQLGAAEAGRRQTVSSLARAHERIAVEVRNAVTSLETASGRIQAARAGLAAAQTQLRAEQDRFDAGLTTNFFVLTRQNDLAMAQLAEIAALTDFQKALTEIARATGTLLQDRGIRVE